MCLSLLGQESVSLSYMTQVTVHREKSRQELKQGRNLEVGADNEAVEKASAAAYWPALLGLLSLLSNSIQNHLLSPEGAPPTVSRALLYRLLNQENAYWQPEGVSQLRFPLPK